MRRALRWGVLAVVALVAVAALVGCGEEKTTGEFYFFEYEEDFLSDSGCESLSSLSYHINADKMLWKKDRTSSDEPLEIFISDVTNGKTETVPFDNEEYNELNDYQQLLSFFRFVAILPDGSQLFLWYHPVETDSSQGQQIDVGGVNYLINTNIYFLTLVKDGKTVWEFDLSDTPMKDCSKSTVIVKCSGDGTIFLFSRSGMLFTLSSDDGTLIEIELPEGDIDAPGRLNPEVDNEGRFCLVNRVLNIDSNMIDIYRYNEETGSFDEPERFTVATDGSIGYFFAPGHDLYLKMSGAVWFLDRTDDGKTTEPELLFEWLDVGLTSDMVGDIYPISEDEWFIIYADDGLHSGRIKRCELSEYMKYYAARNGEEAAKALENRKTLYVVTTENLKVDAYGSLTPKLMSSIQRFNRGNQQYELKLDRISGDETTVSGNLMRRMLAGDLPDVIAFTDGMRSGNFSRQDMFTDLYELMDNDKAHPRESFLPCVLSTFEKDGHLPLLTTDFNLRTIISYSDDSPEPGSTMEELFGYADRLGADEKFMAVDPFEEIYDKPRKIFMDDFLRATLGNFIDYGKKTCDFESGEFRQLIEFAKNGKFCRYMNYSMTDARMFSFNFRNLFTYLKEYKPFYTGKELKFIGYPHGEGTSGTAIEPKIQFAITDGSENKSGAWSFITSYVDTQSGEYDGFYDVVVTAGGARGINEKTALPCTVEAMDNLFEYISDLHSITTITYRKNLDGKISQTCRGMLYWNYKSALDKEKNEFVCVEDYSYREPGWLVKYAESQKGTSDSSVTALYSEFTEPELDAFRAVFNEKCLVWSDDNETMNIINEEISGYFAGTKTLDEVVGMIQDRVTTRINE